MNCAECQEQIVAYLESALPAQESQDVAAHLQACPTCAAEGDEHARIRERLLVSAATISQIALHTRVMDVILREETRQLRSIAMRRKYGLIRFGTLAVAASLLLAVGTASLFHWLTRDRKAPRTSSAYYLFSKACAAEEAFFANEKLAYLVNEIVVKPATDPTLARMRWLPVVSIDQGGQPRFNQLKLPAEPGEQYVVEDQAWYDPATGRFTRVMTAGGKPIFGNSYDGTSVYTLNVDSSGAVQVVGTPVTGDFRSPAKPADFLGIAAGLHSNLRSDDERWIQDAGTGTLADGAAVRVLKAAQPEPPGGGTESYWLFRIREDNSTIAEMEWIVGDESLLVVRRVKTETAEAPGVAWNLAGLSKPATATEPAPKAGISPDMVIPNASVRQMIEKAGFETCIFATDPPWAGQRQITDILDVPSPPHRMYAVSYRATDGRHVVLVQSHTFNQTLRAMTILPGSKLVYTSPKGFKAWSGPADRMKWMAGILLKSAEYDIKDPPSKDATSYLLETPAGTFPVLAINGKLTDKELKSLIDSLVPAREYKGE